ncbi:MAG TPA: WYL domain-containing protein [Streptosporangiaceae bacterium]
MNRTESRSGDRQAVVYPFPGHTGGQDTADAIVAAIEQQRVLSLVYGDRLGTVTEREAEPVGLLWGPHGWYVLAWCRLRAAPRGFRLDRMRSARLLAETFIPRDAMDLHRELARQETDR